MLRSYFNQRAAIWDETVAERDASRLERIARRLNIKSGSALLDVGTGTGVFIPYLLKRVGKDGQIVALDIAEEMLEKARAKGFNGNIEYLQADAANIPLRGEIFDIVVCYSSFPHFQDKPGAFAEMHRVIRRGGRLLICHTKSRAAINEIHRQIFVLKNDAIPDGGEMQLMLLMAGFTEIKVGDNSDSYLTSAEKP